MHLLLALPLFLLLLLQHTTAQLPVATAAASGGRWALLQPNIGIVAMHMQLLHTDKVVIFDRTDFGSSNISLPRGKCLKVDCTAHSVEYDVVCNSVRPLTVLTDVWCSSGSVMPDGTLFQTGGHNDGERVVRTFSACSNSGEQCDWKEINNALININLINVVLIFVLIP